MHQLQSWTWGLQDEKRGRVGAILQTPGLGTWATRPGAMQKLTELTCFTSRPVALQASPPPGGRDLLCQAQQSPTCTSRRTQRSRIWAGEVAQRGSMLPCEHLGQSLIPRTHILKKTGTRVHARNPITGTHMTCTHTYTYTKKKHSSSWVR